MHDFGIKTPSWVDMVEGNLTELQRWGEAEEVGEGDADVWRADVKQLQMLDERDGRQRRIEEEGRADGRVGHAAKLAQSAEHHHVALLHASQPEAGGVVCVARDAHRADTGVLVVEYHLQRLFPLCVPVVELQHNESAGDCRCLGHELQLLPEGYGV